MTQFFCIHPPPELLPVLGLLEQYMLPTIDATLLCSSRAGSDLGHDSDRFEEITRHHGLINICDYVLNELLFRGAKAGFEPGT